MRLRLLLATAAVAASVPAGVGIESACAGEGPRAVLVVDAGQRGGVHRYCVALAADNVSGIRLIQLANEQHGLSYRLGHGGQAVCMLAGVGPAEGDCFGEYPDFWGYWRGDSSGGWRWSNVGAGSTVVGDGDVDGWSWGRGDSPSSHPKPPRTKFSEVCPVAKEAGARPAPREEPRGSTQDPARARPESTGGGEEAGSRPAREQRGDEAKTARPAPRPRTTHPALSVSPDAEPSPAHAHAASDRGSAPPAGGLAALGATVVLAAAGVIAARRRKRG